MLRVPQRSTAFSPRYIASARFLHRPFCHLQPSHIPSHLWEHHISLHDRHLAAGLSQRLLHLILLFSPSSYRTEKKNPARGDFRLDTFPRSLPPIMTSRHLLKPDPQAANIWLIGRSWPLNYSEFSSFLRSEFKMLWFFTVRPIAFSPSTCIFSPKSAASVLAALLVVQQCRSRSLGCIQLQHVDFSAHLSWSDIFILFQDQFDQIRSLKTRNNHAKRGNTQCWAAFHYGRIINIMYVNSCFHPHMFKNFGILLKKCRMDINVMSFVSSHVSESLSNKVY